MTEKNNTTINHHLQKNMINKIERYGLAWVLACMLSIGLVSAQDRTITINEALKLGLDNSKTLKLSQARIDRAVSQYNQVTDRVLPTGNVSLAYSHAEIPANTLELGPTKFSLPSRADAFIGTASIQETIFGGYRYRYAKESTDLLTQSARLDADRDKDQIAYDIINQFFSLYKVQQSQKVVTQNLSAIDQQLKQAQRFFEQGLVTKNDVLRFQLQRSNTQLNGIDLESNRKVINYNLDVLLGLPETTQLKIDTLVNANRSIGTLANYIDTALATRQEVKQLDLQNRSAEINIKSVTAEKLPTLGAGVNAYYVDASANPFPQYGQYLAPITIGLSLNWNFGALWNNKNKVAEARIQRDETLINKDIVIDNLKREVNGNYQNYLQAVDKISLLQTSIAQASENNKILESKYRSNIASVTDRVDAQTLLYQAEISLELAKADAGLAYYNLLKATGKLNK
jgi:outer membrane protein